MKVLVTGSNGFLGGELLDFLKSKEVPYIVYDRNNPEKLEIDFDSVVNLGGRTPNSDTKTEGTFPELYYDANVRGTEILLKTIEKNRNLKKFVNIGTVAEYGFSADPITENTERKPRGPYAESKFEQSKLVKNFFKEKGVKVINLCLFNVAGLPKRSRNLQDSVNDIKNPFIFESLVRQFGHSFDGKIIISNKEDIRDYVDIEDIMRAILLALETKNGEQHDVINICTGVGTKLEEVADLFGKVTGKNYEICPICSNEPTCSIGDNSKAKKILGWSPEVSLEESIKKMI